MEKILVTGATGTIGKALVNALQKKDVNFKAAVRNPETDAAKLPGVDLVSFDFADSSTFKEATKDVGRVFLLGPPLVTNLDELLTPFIDYLKSNGILRVVYIASLGCEKMEDLPFHTIIADKLQSGGFDFTILKPSFFAQNFKNYEWDNITQRKITYTPAGDGKAAFIDVEDIAEVAATVLITEGHSHQTYELTGPEALSYSDAAHIISEVLGEQIVYPNPTPAEYAATLKTGGAPDFIAPYMISVYSLLANDEVNLVTGDVKSITGKEPATLRAVIERDFLSR